MRGLYKCRLCGDTFCKRAVNREIADRIMIDIAIYGKSKILQAPDMIVVHSCDDDSMGVADFIGFKKEATDD